MLQKSSILLDCLNCSLKVLQSLLSWNEIKGVDQKEVRLVCGSHLLTFEQREYT